MGGNRLSLLSCCSCRLLLTKKLDPIGAPVLINWTTYESLSNERSLQLNCWALREVSLFPSRTHRRDEHERPHHRAAIGLQKSRLRHCSFRRTMCHSHSGCQLDVPVAGEHRIPGQIRLGIALSFRRNCARLSRPTWCDLF